MVSSPNASCRRPVAPSTRDQRPPGRATVHGDHRWHRERDGTEAEQRRRAPHRGCDHDDYERGGDQPDVQAARCGVADAHGERALARRRVRGNVTQVVHHQECARDRADRAPHQHAERGDLLDRDVRRADGRDEAEEREHEQLTEAEVAVGLGPSGVSPGRADARQADGDQPPRRGGSEHQPGDGRDRERAERGSLHGRGRRQPGRDQSHRADADVVGAAHAVGVVVGVVHADLQRQADHEREGDTPPADRTVTGRGPGADGDRDDRGRQGARPRPEDPRCCVPRPRREPPAPRLAAHSLALAHRAWPLTR